MKDLILAIDQGTTGTTALLIDHGGRILSARNVEFRSHFPSPGLVEHEPGEIWDSVAAAVTGVLGSLDPGRIAALGITNQRETCLFWDARTGEAAHRAIVWQDRRTASRCDELRDAGREPWFTGKTGLVLDPYFSATKAEWMLENVAGLREGAASGRLLFGTVESWLVHSLCGAHVSDVSNASRTLLFDIDRLEWDPELCAVFGVPEACLPRLVGNSEVVGETRGAGFLPDGIPIAGLAGDQQAALFGQACFSPGMAKCTYGTGAFVLVNIGSPSVRSKHRLLTTVAWRLAGRTTYALEGSSFVAGAAVQWLRDGLQLFEESPDVESLAASVPDSGGVVFVPALTGLGAPHWRADARGVISGLTRGTTRAHLARATLDGIALQVADMLDAMTKDAERPLLELRVDGGAARNDLLMQIQADILDVPCVRPVILETTALGAGFLAGLGTGFWESEDSVSRAWEMNRRFTPEMAASERLARKAGWEAAVRKA